jgi:hypothetical protein
MRKRHEVHSVWDCGERKNLCIWPEILQIRLPQPIQLVANDAFHHVLHVIKHQRDEDCAPGVKISSTPNSLAWAVLPTRISQQKKTPPCGGVFHRRINRGDQPW